jgi:hypothetical protein
MSDSETDFVVPKKKPGKKKQIDSDEEIAPEKPKSTPKRKKTSKKKEEEDEDHEPSQSKGRGKKNQLDKTEQDKMVSDLVRFILFMDSQKKPIKRADMTKQVFKDHKNISTQMIELAKTRLKDAFGYELVELSAKKGNSNKRMQFDYC